MTAHQPQSVRRPLLRSRRQIWFAGVCGGLGEYFGLNAGLIRFAFLVAALSGVGVLVYLVLWVAMPMEPDADADASYQSIPGLRNIAIGIALMGAAFALQLVLADGRTFALGWGVVVAPAIVAIAAAIVRGGRPLAWLSLAALGLGITLLLAALNYGPTVGGRSEQPTSPVELTRGYSNAFGTMTIDLTAMDLYGNLRLKANSAFGDVIVRVPDRAEIRGYESALATTGDPGLVIDLDVHTLFGSVTVVRE